jgi:hypothetical protein
MAIEWCQSSVPTSKRRGFLQGRSNSRVKTRSRGCAQTSRVTLSRRWLLYRVFFLKIAGARFEAIPIQFNIQRGSIVAYLTVARSSCGRCAQHLRRIRGCDERIRYTRSLVPVVSHLRISLMGLAPSDQDRAPECVARSRSEARGFTRLVYMYVTQMLRAKLRCASCSQRTSCKCYAHLPRNKGCYFWTPLYAFVLVIRKACPVKKIYFAQIVWFIGCLT